MSSPPPAPWIGAILRLVWQGIRNQIGEAVHQAGFLDVTAGHVSLFRYPGLDGSRPTQLADELQISKQAVNDLLRELEQRGYIRREMDPYDKRSRIIRLTPAGVRLESVILQAARDAESRLERQLGRDRFRSLRASLVEASGLLQTEQKPSAETGG
jgi:DNA-binding MarR family transcriptional regulator